MLLHASPRYTLLCQLRYKLGETFAAAESVLSPVALELYRHRLKGCTREVAERSRGIKEVDTTGQTKTPTESKNRHAVIHAEKCQFRTEKCQYRHVVIHNPHPASQPNPASGPRQPKLRFLSPNLRFLSLKLRFLTSCVAVCCPDLRQATAMCEPKTDISQFQADISQF